MSSTHGPDASSASTPSPNRAASGSQPPHQPFSGTQALPDTSPHPGSRILTGFTTAGAGHYANVTNDYLITLEQMSRSVAKSKGSTVVDNGHVSLAAQALGTDAGSKGVSRLGDIGLFLAGAAIGYLGNVVIGSEYTFGNALIVFVPLTLGIALYCYSWGRG